MNLNAHTQWLQILYLAVAIVLSTAIGMERQLRNKSAGMRTHTLVGLGAALFMVVSKYGFHDVLAVDLIRLDPSRVAAQIVSGIGFIGAGLVFVRRNKVRGLTTAASIWLTAAVGTAAGAGLIIPAVFVTLAHFLIVSVYPIIVRRTALGDRQVHYLKVQYLDGTGALRDLLLACTQKGFQIQGFNTHRGNEEMGVAANGMGRVVNRLLQEDAAESVKKNHVVVELEIEGTAPISELISQMSHISSVSSIAVDDTED